MIESCHNNDFTFHQGSKKSGDTSADVWGLLLLLGSLTFDGLTGTETDKHHKETKRDFAYPGMFVNNMVGLVLSLVIYTVGVFSEGDDTHTRIFSDRQTLFDCVMVGLTGSIGQVFIFFCISVFDCYLLSVITTTRKFFSVVYSNFRFGHNFNHMQWVGAIIVMICTAAELMSKKGKAAPKTERKDKKE